MLSSFLASAFIQIQLSDAGDSEAGLVTQLLAPWFQGRDQGPSRHRKRPSEA